MNDVRNLYDKTSNSILIFSRQTKWENLIDLKYKTSCSWICHWDMELINSWRMDWSYKSISGIWMNEREQWNYLKEETLTRKWKKICITCNQFSYGTNVVFTTILICPIHEKLIPQVDQLIKGCKCWRENRTIFAPEAA